MATLASVRLAEQGFQVKAVYTFGSPRVGDEVFHDAYQLNACNYRFVNYDDIVPHLPLRAAYKHVGTPELLNEDGKLAAGQQAWDAKKLVLQATARKSAGSDQPPSGHQCENRRPRLACRSPHRQLHRRFGEESVAHCGAGENEG